jgi:hypothetical protein
MRRLGRGSLLAALVCLFVVPIAAPAGPAETVGGPLRPAPAGPAPAYRFDRLATCRLGDALSVVENVGPVPVRLDALSLLYGGAARPGAQRASFELVSFRRGTFTGQLADTFRLSALDLGTLLGAAPGATLLPLSTSGRWYVLVADVSIVGSHPKPWSIRGLGVSYHVGETSYSRLFAQSIRLPATSRCR